MTGAMQLLRKYTADAEAFLRELTPCEEDRHLFTSAPWRGEYRWFRSPNVIPFEQYGRPTGAVDGSQAA
jgi:hypothetical protein